MSKYREKKSLQTATSAKLALVPEVLPGDPQASAVQVTEATAANLAALEQAALEELDKKLLVGRHRIRMVARGDSVGFYWHGRPGTGKTHTVLSTLDTLQVAYHYHRGHITHGGLLEIMEKYATMVIVLDDVSAIFEDKKAVQILLAALGRQHGKPLPLGYSRQGKHVSFEFRGGIICVSNLSLTPKGTLAAFKSRVHTLRHNPTDAMLIALCRHRICEHGWPSATPVLNADEINEVINWVQVESTRLSVPVDLRVILDKALPDYRAWKEKKTEACWKDLVTTTLEEEVNCLTYTSDESIRRGVRQAVKDWECQLVREILSKYPDRRDRIAEWTKLSNGKSERAFDRRRAEVKAVDMAK